ncbi:MAG: peptidylprolyl isomerase, partial [Actinobacteria bacterium]|nr:peptidylprolyl isomerase [Actinomycetota bacterium]
MKKILFVIMSLLLTLCGGDDLPESTTVISDQECLSASEIKEIELSISESEIS